MTYYTNNIFQLVNLIVKDPVFWPPGMDHEFKVRVKPEKARNRSGRPECSGRSERAVP